MEKIYYKIGQTVYHFKFGEGIVQSIDPHELYQIDVKFNDYNHSFTLEGAYTLEESSTLSHTPYDLVNGGFTRKELIIHPDIAVDTPVLVRNSEERWHLRYFSHFDKEDNIFCFNNQFKSVDTKLTSGWDEYKLLSDFK